MVETITGELLISTRPYAVTKWSAWLVSKESPISQAPSPITLKSATLYSKLVSHPTLLLSSPYNPAHNTRVTDTLCSQYYGQTEQRAGMSSGECNKWPVGRHKPQDATGCIVQSSTNVPSSSSTM